MDERPKRTPAQFAKVAGRAAVRSGVTSASVTAVLSTVRHAGAVTRGELSPNDALRVVAVDTGNSALNGVAKGVAGAALKSTAETIAQQATTRGLRTAARALSRSGAPFAAGTVLVDAVSSGAKVASGDIDSKEFASRIGVSVSCAAGAWAAAGPGAIIGTVVMPGIGTFVGGLLGGIVGALGAASLYRAGRGD